jgi:hypothetical protein
MGIIPGRNIFYEDSGSHKQLPSLSTWSCNFPYELYSNVVWFGSCEWSYNMYIRIASVNVSQPDTSLRGNEIEHKFTIVLDLLSTPTLQISDSSFLRSSCAWKTSASPETGTEIEFEILPGTTSRLETWRLSLQWFLNHFEKLRLHILVYPYNRSWRTMRS